MVQYEVVKEVFDSETPIPKNDLIKSLDFHPSTTRAGIKDCIKKGYIENTERGLVATDDLDKSLIERIRPRTLDELMD
jgi:Mn-dependent DtxR family transcriptional regulator